MRYSNVYPGIDLVYYGNQRQLEYDFIVSTNLGPLSVMSISGSTPKGTYDFSSRIFDPVTGKQLSQDYNEFKIQ